MTTNPEYLSVRWASIELGEVAEGTIREAISKGDLPASRFGRAVRIARSDLMAWAKSKSSAA